MQDPVLVTITITMLVIYIVAVIVEFLLEEIRFNRKIRKAPKLKRLDQEKRSSRFMVEEVAEASRRIDRSSKDCDNRFGDLFDYSGEPMVYDRSTGLTVRQEKKDS